MQNIEQLGKKLNKLAEYCTTRQKNGINGRILSYWSRNGINSQEYWTGN